MADRLSHVEVLRRNWMHVGASVWLIRPGAGLERPVTEEDRVGEGEALAFHIGDIGLRLWTRRAEAALTGGGLRVSIKSAGPVLVGEIGVTSLPALGQAAWARPPAFWLAWERRRAFRVAVHTYCQVRLSGQVALDEEPLVRRVVNLSTTGAAIEGIPARVGDEATVVLELAPVAPPVTLQVRVVRQESAAMGAHTALAFQPDEAAQAALLQYLLAVSARHLASALRR